MIWLWKKNCHCAVQPSARFLSCSEIKVASVQLVRLACSHRAAAERQRPSSRKKMLVINLACTVMHFKGDPNMHRRSLPLLLRLRHYPCTASPVLIIVLLLWERVLRGILGQSWVRTSANALKLHRRPRRGELPGCQSHGPRILQGMGCYSCQCRSQ